MKLNRGFTNKFNWILDNLIPAVLRDNKIFMAPFFYLLFKKKAKYFMEFKEKAPYLSKDEFKSYYSNLADSHLKRETDLNIKSINEILDNLVGEKILDIATGRGFLANKIAEEKKKQVTGIDIFIPDELKNNNNPVFIEGKIEQIPFEDNYFDTVVCTHTLEHVRYIEQTIKELRRVTNKRLIIVVPRQREFKYTFDLHIHFFPYTFSLEKLMKNINSKCFLLDNDIFYMENINK